MTQRRGHNDGSIRKRADGTWEARVSLPLGRRQSFYGKTRKEAQDKMRAAQRDLDSGLDIAAGRLTVTQFLEKWLASSVKPSVKVKTYEGYESIVRVRVIPRIGARQLTRLTPLDLQTLYTDLQEAGLSSRSVQHTHRVLHRALTQAVRWNMTLRNPCDGVTPPQAIRKELCILNQEQVTTMLDATRDHPWHALYALAVTTGMRLGELLGLRWSDVDLESGRLAVRRALQRQNVAGLVFIEPKTARSRRSILLSQRAIATLRRHRSRQNEQRLLVGPGWTDGDLVFCNPTGDAPDPGWVRQVFQGELRRAGLPVIRFHDLRHSAATLLLSKGVHPKVVSEMLGHATITLTLDTYSHLVPLMHAQAATAMDAMLGA